MAQSTVAKPAKAANPFATDSGDELPLSVQLSWRLRALIASQRLAPGEQLPSVRTLAEWAGVNVNTVRDVYRDLEDEGLVTTQQGKGTFVAPDVPSSPEVERIAADAIAEALAGDVDPRDVGIAMLVGASLGGLDVDLPAETPPAVPTTPDFAPDSERAVRRELRRQIERLEGELAHYGEELAEQPKGRQVRQGPPHVANVKELERTRNALMKQLAETQKTAERKAGHQQSARGRREAMLSDPAAHKWEIVSAEQIGEPGCTTWQVAPRYGPLGALMSWWRVKVSGGCPLAAPREAAARHRNTRRRDGQSFRR
jgi:GntR family transcriptional regulator